MWEGRYFWEVISGRIMHWKGYDGRDLKLGPSIIVDDCGCSVQAYARAGYRCIEDLAVVIDRVAFYPIQLIISIQYSYRFRCPHRLLLPAASPAASPSLLFVRSTYSIALRLRPSSTHVLVVWQGSWYEERANTSVNFVVDRLICGTYLVLAI